jgi:hypothetical protein
MLSGESLFECAQLDERYLVSAAFLAGGAEGGGAGGDLGGLEGGLAAGAGVAGVAVGLEVSGEGAGLVGDVAVVAEGGAAGAEGVVEDLFDGGDEGFEVGGFEAADLLEGVEFGEEEGFVDVDVAEARDVALGEEAVFEPACAGGFPVGEVGGGEGEGVGTEGGDFGVEGLAEGGVVPEATEAAGVAEADVGAVGEVKDDVGVLFEGGGGGECVDAAGHAEVNEEGLGAVGSGGGSGGGGDEEEFFAVAEGAGEREVEKVAEGGILRSEEVGAEDLDACDGDAQEEGFEGAADFFDFGEFRHSGRL